MSEIIIGDLTEVKNVLIYCSTWGEGDMPDNAVDLWEAANGDSPPSLEGCNFAVCALGDTSYEFFCQSGKDWDGWFEKQGATRILDRVDCDVEYEEPAAEFTSKAVSIFSSMAGGAPIESQVNEDLPPEPAVEKTVEVTGDNLGELLSAGDRSLLVLSGSQSGNSEGVAAKVGKMASDYGLEATVKGMDEIKIAEIANFKRILVICSTWGEGDMPDNAEDLWNSANGPDAPNLSGSHFSVCSLGDSSYEFFCQSGIDWDGWFANSGSNCIVSRVDCDVDYDAPSNAWIADSLAHMGAVGGDGTFNAEMVEVLKEKVSGGGSGPVAGSSFEIPELVKSEIKLDVRVFRYNSISGESGHDIWHCAVPGSLSVLELLQLLKSTEDGSLTFRAGNPDDSTTAISVNGRNILPGRYSISELLNSNESVLTLRIDPLPGFDVIRDLVVDHSDYRIHYENSKPWMHAATRGGANLSQGVIGTMDASTATQLHILGDVSSPHILHASSDTVPHNRSYVGPAVISKLWARYNDPRVSDIGKDRYLEVINSEFGVKAEADISSVSRSSRSGKIAGLNLLLAKRKALQDSGFNGRHGKHVWWFSETVKMSGKLNESILAGATMGPFGMVKNVATGVLPRMALGFTRTGGPMIRDLQALAIPPSSTGKMPKMINSSVENHHEVVALFNAFDRRF